MPQPVQRRRRARGSIDPEKILDGAFEIAERDGLDNLSMPDLAAHLDVGVTSIYWYFRNKEEMLRRMSARASSEIWARLVAPDAAAPDEWRAILAAHIRSQRDVYAESNLYTEITVMRTATYSTRTTHMVYGNIEKLLRYLMSAGFRLESAWYVYSTLSIFVRGHILAEYSRRVNGTPPTGLAQLSLLDPETMPLMSKLVSELPIVMDMTGDLTFDVGLDMILDSAESLLAGDRDDARDPRT